MYSPFSYVLVAAMSATCFAQENTSDEVGKWEKDFIRFEEADQKAPPKPGQVLFIGSSSIRRWDLAASFPNLDALNRGFGGSELSDSVDAFERIVAPYAPRTIVMYAGDNDISHDKTPITVYRDFQAFVVKMREQLPQTRLIYIAIKPSLKRWKLIHRIRAANALIAMECQEDDSLTFLDIDTPMIGQNGELYEFWFVKDGLHLSEVGYALWADLLRPHLEFPTVKTAEP